MKSPFWAVIATVALVVLAAWWWPVKEPDPMPRRTIAVTRVLGGTAEPGFARAFEPRAVQFPKDHAAHPDFQSEWWYFTGNLFNVEDSRFGYQLTLFRFATSDHAAESTSTWRNPQIFMGHLTLTDTTRQQFMVAERVSRTGAGLAGAGTAPTRVWVRDWVIEHNPDNDGWQLTATADDFGISLNLVPEKNAVLHGENGLSRKSSTPGNASYYYSYPRLATSGSIELRGQRQHVQGRSWLDREWSTSALDPNQAGWDWFSLQLSDGTDLMFYRLRTRDGGSDPFSSGSFVAADGSIVLLAANDVALEVRDHWRSPHSGVIYPSAWLLRVPRLNLQLEIDPLQRDQELNVSIRYWEGAVDAHGKRAQHTVSGRGYVELAGYAPDNQTSQNQGNGR